MPTYMVGVWNVKKGRKPEVMRREAEQQIKEHNLDILALQETEGRRYVYKDIKGFQAIMAGQGKASQNHVTLVKKGIKVTNVKTRRLTKIRWKRWNGNGMHPRRRGLLCTVDGVLRIMNCHAPPGGPNQKNPRQQKAFRQFMRHLRRWMTNVVKKPFIAPGDWNVGQRVKGKFTAQWLARVTGSKVNMTNGPSIDYILSRDCKVEYVTTGKKFNSDHHIRVYKVTV